MSESLKGAWIHTLGATVVSVVGFFILIYVVAPIFESLLNLHGRYFVPERFGGGTAVDNPSLLTLLKRGVLVSGLSAVGGLYGALFLFCKANSKFVAIAFGVVVATWASLFVVVGLMTGELFMSLVTLGLGMVPPLAVAYWIWQS